MKVGHSKTNRSAAFGLDVNINNESLFEKIVISFAYLMLDALFRQIRRINKRQLLIGYLLNDNQFASALTTIKTWQF